MISANDPKRTSDKRQSGLSYQTSRRANPFKFSCIGSAPSESRQDFDLYCVGSSHSDPVCRAGRGVDLGRTDTANFRKSWLWRPSSQTLAAQEIEAELELIILVPFLRHIGRAAAFLLTVNLAIAPQMATQIGFAFAAHRCLL